MHNNLNTHALIDTWCKLCSCHETILRIKRLQNVHIINNKQVSTICPDPATTGTRKAHGLSAEKNSKEENVTIFTSLLV